MLIIILALVFPLKSFKMFEFEERDFEKMLKKHERTKETLQEDVEALREWMKGQPHLPEILDEKRIRNFLLLNKCSIEKTKRNIDNYYTIRSHIPDVYDNANPEDPLVKNAMDAVYFVPMPKLTKEMYRVVWCKVKNKDLVAELDPRPMIAYELNTYEVRLAEDHMYGDIIVFDMKDVSWSYMLRLTPSMIVKNLKPFEKVYSLPMRAIYIINALPSVETVLSVIKGLKEKLFKRIEICKDTSLVFEKFPKETIPKDYGGTEKSMEELQDELKKKFRAHKARFDLLDELRVNENLRPEKLKNDDILGFHGNFKQLSVD